MMADDDIFLIDNLVDLASSPVQFLILSLDDH